MVQGSTLLILKHKSQLGTLHFYLQEFIHYTIKQILVAQQEKLLKY